MTRLVNELPWEIQFSDSEWFAIDCQGMPSQVLQWFWDFSNQRLSLSINPVNPLDQFPLISWAQDGLSSTKIEDNPSVRQIIRNMETNRKIVEII